VFWKKRNRDEHRYYLLPGMGRSNRRKRKQYFRSAIIFGILVSVVLATLLYYFSRPRL
jgi:Na+-driven multidrug efflux pump